MCVYIYIYIYFAHCSPLQDVWQLDTTHSDFELLLDTVHHRRLRYDGHCPLSRVGSTPAIWDVHNIRHSVLPDFGCTLDIGPVVDIAQWLSLSVQRAMSIAELGGSMSKVLLSECAMSKTQLLVSGFVLVDDVWVRKLGQLS